MGKWDGVRKNGYRAAAIALAACAVCLAVDGNGAQDGPGKLLLEQAEAEMISLWNPAFSFAEGSAGAGGGPAFFPVLRFFGKEREPRLQAESTDTCEEIIRAEGRDEEMDSLTAQELLTPETSGGRVQAGETLEELVRRENGVTEDRGREGGGTASGAGLEGAQSASGDGQEESGAGSGSESGQTASGQESAAAGEGGENAVEGGAWGDGAPAYAASDSPRQQVYQWEYYEKYDELMKEFYAVDASTAIDESQLNLEALLGRDLSVEKRRDGDPQILIYHTHSQEGFADSAPGDPSATVMGVGEVLTRILRDQYGYNVLHHLGQYDVEDRDYAYNNSLPALEALLEEYPGIEVIIALHRDEVADDRRLVTEIDGRPTAMFMFFNGLSRTRKHGDIDYLPNENLADNLAFSFQMQVLCNEYYPGLTRRIYLKGYRYNMHLKPRYLLIEMGAQNNTYEECCNACIPLARMLDLELSGADFGYGG